MPSVSSAIIKTIIYADLFDYPLTAEEIFKRIIKCPSVSKIQLHRALSKTKDIREKNNFYFLKGRKNIIKIRKKRENYSKEKLKIAKKAVNLLKYIPTVKLIGISGNLAINNAEKNDDIDFFIISSADFLWTTRLAAILILELAGMRRRRDDKNIKDKICLNMFIDENHLAIPKKERDLFSAHEVVQMKSLYDREGIYNKFLQANIWVKKYLPNAFEEDGKRFRYFLKRKNKKTFNLLVSKVNILEKICRFFQLYYLRKHKTREVIKNGFVRFHPHDAREWILKKYSLKVTT